MTARASLVVASDGEEIGVEVAGSGPALVLLHGSGGNRLTWWQQVVDLASSYTVVVVEARGSGRSTDRADQTGPVAGVRDLEAVRRELGLSSWHLVGHSLGGWTALRYACTHPAQALSCVLVSSYAGVFPPEADRAWAALAARPWEAQPLAAPASLAAASRGTPGAHLYQLVGAVNPSPSATSPAARIRSYDLSAAELAALAAPVTCVVGAEDEIAPVAAVSAVASSLGAALHVVEGAGHVPFWEQPAAFNALVREACSGPSA